MTKGYEDLQKLVFSFLKALDFRMVRYHPYESIVDIMGYIRPPEPLKIPMKIAIEITALQVTEDLIERFQKISKNSAAERSMIFTDHGITSSAQDSATRYQIEVLLGNDLRNIVKKIDEQATKHYERISDIVSSLSLARMLPEVARQGIPLKLADIAGEMRLKPWQLFEESVYSVFWHCFHYHVRQLGSASLFEREPEGVVVVDNNFAFVYECKSAKEAYQMTVNDERAYAEYINEKKDEVKVLDKSDLKYFVIISPEFKGNIEKRRDNIYSATNVLVVFMKASSLSLLGQWIYRIPSDVKKLFDITTIFKISQLVVSDDVVNKQIELFERKYRSRW